MVFHAEGLAVHYAAQLTVQPVRGFKNSNHHFPAPYALSINLPPMFPLLVTTPLGCHARSLPNRCRLSGSAGRLYGSACSWLYCTCMKIVPRPQEICCNNCIPVALHTYIHTYVGSPCDTISCLTSHSAIKLRPKLLLHCCLSGV